ncbi:MAG: ATP-binding protein [Saprospiraceae bacterium]
MLEIFDRFLPENITDDERISIRILEYFIFFTILACFLLTILDWFFPSGDDTPFLLIAVVNIILVFILKYTAAKSIVGNVYIGIWAIILADLSFHTGGLYSMDALSMTLVPLTGFALVNYKSGFGWLVFYLAYLFYLWMIIDTPEMSEFYRAQTLVFNKNYYVFGGLIFSIFTFCMFSIFYFQNQKLMGQLKTNQVALKKHVELLDQQSILLKEVRDDLRRSNAELEEFAYITSHDLKQPLRTVNSFAILLQNHLKKQEVLDGETSQMLKFIIAGSSKMNTLITDLLAFAKLKKEEEIIFTNVKLEKLFQSVLFDLKYQIDTSGVLIHLGHLPELPIIPVKMNQLFQNLISNAIKFRKKQENLIIRVRAKEKAIHWEFSIEDNGIGIKKEHQEKIFAPFKKLHNSSEIEGSGIGLATCMHIVKLHKGRIWADSDFGVGTTFRFTIAKDLTTIQKAKQKFKSPEVIVG